MNFVPAKTPLVVKDMFPNYIWNMDSSTKNIYLTFDDGPTPHITDWVLDVLQDFEAKATFFCIGKNVSEQPKIFNRIIDEGHIVGNHTNNHIKGWKTKTKNYLKNIDEAQAVLQSTYFKNENGIRDSRIEGQTIGNLFRPPYGQLTPKQGKRLIKSGFKIVMWQVLSFDWDKRISKKKCLDRVISNTTNGSIVVFHDSIKASKNMQYSLPKVLAHFKKKGFSFESISPDGNIN